MQALFSQIVELAVISDRKADVPARAPTGDRQDGADQTSRRERNDELR
jgi:hypothetical protein